jgi:D-alanine-D-alanine ligase
VEKLVRFIVEGESVDIVFNIAEGVWGRNREAQVPAILEAWHIPYVFSDALTMTLCLDKAMAKRLFQHAELPTPDFCVISDISELSEEVDLPDFPLFVKPIHEGTSKGIDAGSVVVSPSELSSRVEWVLDTYRQPALVERYLAGPEFTVGVLGNGPESRALGVLKVSVLDSNDGVYGFLQKEECETRVAYTPVESTVLVDDLTKLAIKAYHVLECKDAGRVDIRLDETGNMQLLEVNPLPGLHPTHSDLPMMAPYAGLSYGDMIGEILCHSIRRWGL